MTSTTAVLNTATRNKAAIVTSTTAFLTTGRSLLSSPSFKWAAGGWSFFIVENVVLSENRTFIIDALGEDLYHLLYGSLSTIAMATVGCGYWFRVRGAGPFVAWWSKGIGNGNRFASFMARATGLGMASQCAPKIQFPFENVLGGNSNKLESMDIDRDDNSIKKTDNSNLLAGPTLAPSTPVYKWKIRCPFDFTDSSQQNSDGLSSSSPQQQPFGIERVTSHPGLWAFALVSLGAVPLTASLPSRLWFSMPSLVSCIGGAHHDSRQRRGLVSGAGSGKLSDGVESATGNIPFVSLLTSGQGGPIMAMKQLSTEIRGTNLALSVAVAGIYTLMATTSAVTRGRSGASSATAVTAVRRFAKKYYVYTDRRTIAINTQLV